MLIFELFLHCGNVYRCAKFQPSTDFCFNRNTFIDTLFDVSSNVKFIQTILCGTKGIGFSQSLLLFTANTSAPNRVCLYTETLLILSLHFDILMISLLRDVRCKFFRSISFLLTATHSHISKMRGMESQSETAILVLTYFIRYFTYFYHKGV